MDGCPNILLRDNIGNSFNLNSYYKDTYQYSLQRDDVSINEKLFSVYHMMVEEGADKHELHLCANNREVKSYDLSKEIPNLDKKISTEDNSYYYVGYMTGDYLDETVNVDRYEFNFTDSPLLGTITEKELTSTALKYICIYLGADLERIKEEKKKRIDDFVMKAGKVKRYNGRGFGNVQNAAFYCYVIADITDSLAEDAENAGLIRTPDGEGFFGFNSPKGAYIEVISYGKLLKDAKQRNEILFDKLFRPKTSQIMTLSAE